MAGRKQVALDMNVYEAAKHRLREVYREFEQVWVAFSGGKDSTVCLELCLEVATEMDLLPINVFHVDEEAIPYETEEYCRRRYNDPRINFRWLSVPVKHLNACSREQPFWTPWHPDEEHLWVRDMPPESETWEDMAPDGFPDPRTTPTHMMPTTMDLNRISFPPARHGNVAVVLGTRSGEGIARYRLIRVTSEIYISRGGMAPNVSNAYPIYDWTTEDVWHGITRFDWDYNEAYDTMEMAGIGIHDQRCAPPYGAEPIAGLWRFKECWPNIWDRMAHRVKGADSAARYAMTELYGVQRAKKPDDVSWEAYVKHYLGMWDEPMKTIMAKRIRAEINRHYRRFPDDPLAGYAPHPDTGLSWNFLVMLASRGDYKTRKIAKGARPGEEWHFAKLAYDEEIEQMRQRGEIQRGRRSGATPAMATTTEES